MCADYAGQIFRKLNATHAELKQVQERVTGDAGAISNGRRQVLTVAGQADQVSRGLQRDRTGAMGRWVGSSSTEFGEATTRLRGRLTTRQEQFWQTAGTLENAATAVTDAAPKAAAVVSDLERYAQDMGRRVAAATAARDEGTLAALAAEANARADGYLAQARTVAKELGDKLRQAADKLRGIGSDGVQLAQAPGGQPIMPGNSRAIGEGLRQTFDSAPRDQMPAALRPLTEATDRIAQAQLVGRPPDQRDLDLVRGFVGDRAIPLADRIENARFDPATQQAMDSTVGNAVKLMSQQPDGAPADVRNLFSQPLPGDRGVPLEDLQNVRRVLAASNSEIIAGQELATNMLRRSGELAALTTSLTGNQQVGGFMVNGIDVDGDGRGDGVSVFNLRYIDGLVTDMVDVGAQNMDARTQILADQTTMRGLFGLAYADDGTAVSRDMFSGLGDPANRRAYLTAVQTLTDTTAIPGTVTRADPDGMGMFEWMATDALRTNPRIADELAPVVGARDNLTLLANDAVVGDTNIDLGRMSPQDAGRIVALASSTQEGRDLLSVSVADYKRHNIDQMLAGTMTPTQAAELNGRVEARVQAAAENMIWFQNANAADRAFAVQQSQWLTKMAIVGTGQAVIYTGLGFAPPAAIPALMVSQIPLTAIPAGLRYDGFWLQAPKPFLPDALPPGLHTPFQSDRVMPQIAAYDLVAPIMDRTGAVPVPQAIFQSNGQLVVGNPFIETDPGRVQAVQDWARQHYGSYVDAYTRTAEIRYLRDLRLDSDVDIRNWAAGRAR